MEILYFIVRTPTLPVAMYLLILLAAWRFNRLLFDALSIFGFIIMLMAFLASSGEAAVVIALIACVHLSLTFAGCRKQGRSSAKAHAPAESR